MLRNMVYLIIGVVVTILIFSGIFASIPRKQKTSPTASPVTSSIPGGTNVQ